LTECLGHRQHGFSLDKFAETAANPQVKMVEIKPSQGAKPCNTSFEIGFDFSVAPTQLPARVLY
jgi:hypothetical protein